MENDDSEFSYESDLVFLHHVLKDALFRGRRQMMSKLIQTWTREQTWSLKFSI